MITYNDFNKVVADFQKTFPVDQKAFEEAVKSAATFGERLTAVALDAAAKSNEINSRSVSEGIDNLRGVTAVRKEVLDYGKAFTDFIQGQFGLAVRSAEEFGAVAQAAGEATVGIVTEAGELVKDKVSANVDAAVKKTKQSAKSAA